LCITPETTAIIAARDSRRDCVVFFVNWLFRAGASGDHEREAGDRAREYFDRHGRWPD
jgi:hypothetical protein